MPRGPLPKPADQRRRRNAPAIPTTNLPRGGRVDPAPRCPYKLDRKGRAWWKWAWSTPQACAWDEVGHLYLVARRAQLEDDLEALVGAPIEIGLEDLLDAKSKRAVDALVGALRAAAGGKLSLCREMREIDDRLGLTPKGLAQLRWQIVADPEPESSDDEEHLGDRFAGLRAVG